MAAPASPGNTATAAPAASSSVPGNNHIAADEDVSAAQAPERAQSSVAANLDPDLR